MTSQKKITLEDFKAYKPLSERIHKGKEVARALDAKADVLPHSRVFTSFEFEAFIGELTPKRFELLRLASRGRRSISELADACHRDHSAVSKDISKLKALGLVKVEAITNAGHGRKKLVIPVAETISISASFALA
ncbi:MAG: MarR family transcriptional regulator [Sulfuriferula multivorans]|jgi:predicted transcriptional regulator|uniref:MarR family transcriptional regulator n=1 Tax=Sulfuriferula multivorans TaxID=1559896 RepID=A0A7C9P9D9_9PROT|nr:MarR family transcriptional regulator [Sulfuriferula multivorans]